MQCRFSQLVTKKWVFELETSILTTFIKNYKMHALYGILVNFDAVLHFFLRFFNAVLQFSDPLLCPSPQVF